MFEKEAEEYLKKDGTKAEQILNMLNEISPLKITLKQLPFILAMLQQTFKDGAEFGYNKANEWHYVKDELPKESKKYYVYSKQWGIEVRKFFADVGHFECRKNIIIAWKEIVLPKEIE